jgi:hypothetical protein
MVAPNFLMVEEAVGNVTFPISKRELMEMIGDGTVIFNGRNVDLHDIIRDLNDDFFESEDEFRAALEVQYAGILGDDGEPAALPTGPTSTWQAAMGPGAAAGPDEHMEPQE